jgi:hypothetical protein
MGAIWRLCRPTGSASTSHKTSAAPGSGSTSLNRGPLPAASALGTSYSATSSIRTQGHVSTQPKSDFGRIVDSPKSLTEPLGPTEAEAKSALVEVPMRIEARYELAKDLGERYWVAGRRGRSELLDSFCLATGYNRKYALAVLRGKQRRKTGRARRPRPRRYGPGFQRALKVLWEAAGYICSQRLQPFLPDLVPLLERHGQLQLDEETRALLVSASRATVERSLAPLRRSLVTRRLSQTKPGTLLRREVPVIVGRWRELDVPGYLEIDLVSHSGEVAAGDWINTICATDLCTGWTERVAVMGKGQETVLAAIDQIRAQLPFLLLGLHPDNGSEFLNWQLVRYCQREPKVMLARSRPDHKNDNAHVEQKNWTLVRRLIGYDRLDTPAQLAWLNTLYTDLLRPYNNCFQPVLKLTGKQVVDGRTRRKYDHPFTPLRRLLDAGAADPVKITALIELYTNVSPLTLIRQIDRRLAAMPATLEVTQSA